ncbi:MAG: FecR domain-containing protein [Sedimentisphaerales bacterium]|nr:FecR domain-containing protein [Sedimentisphaerales bacterium]
MKTAEATEKRLIRMAGLIVLLGCLWGTLPAWGQAGGAGGPVRSGKNEPNDLTEQLQAVITEVSGKSVQCSLDGGKSWSSAQAKFELPRSAMIRTGFASSCEVSFQGNTVVQVEPLSSMRIADYLGDKLQTREKVDVNLHYGAVRCGVEKGRIRSNTQIITPVSTLAIRGTRTRVEHFRGTGQSILAVLKDGPADATSWKGRYQLSEGMRTDNKLSRYLKTAIIGRTVYMSGNPALGDVTDVEAEVASQVTGVADLFEKRIDFIEGLRGDYNGGCTDGECDPGPKY